MLIFCSSFISGFVGSRVGCWCGEWTSGSRFNALERNEDTQCAYHLRLRFDPRLLHPHSRHDTLPATKYETISYFNLYKLFDVLLLLLLIFLVLFKINENGYRLKHWMEKNFQCVAPPCLCSDSIKSSSRFLYSSPNYPKIIQEGKRRKSI